MITQSAKETRKQKEQLNECQLQVTGKWGRRGWTKFEKGGGGKQYRGVFIKKGGRTPLPTM